MSDSDATDCFWFPNLEKCQDITTPEDEPEILNPDNIPTERFVTVEEGVSLNPLYG